MTVYASQWPAGTRWPGYTYFIQAEHGGPIKIGSTLDDPRKRLKAIQANSPYRLVLLGVLEGVQQERRQHEFFAADRLHGEWFEPKPGSDLQEFVDGWLLEMEDLERAKASASDG